MRNEKIICPVCGTANDLDFKYCKNCGEKLPKPCDNGYSNGYTPEYIPSYYKSGNSYYENDRIDNSTMVSFVGRNSNMYITKFSQMKYTGKSVSWNWIVFVITLVLGPLGAAACFFYRKMYKLGFIFTAVSFVLMGIEGWFSVICPLSNTLNSDVVKSIEDALINEDINGYLNSLSALLSDVVANANNLVENIVFFIECGISLFTSFAFNKIYEKHCEKTIIKYNLCQNKDPLLFKKYGGTKLLWAILIPVFTVGVYVLFTIAATADIVLKYI